MAFVLITRGPENLDDDGVGLGTTPVIVTIDGSRAFQLQHAVQAVTTDSAVVAGLEAFAPPASEQRLAWIAKANSGTQVESVAPEDWVPAAFMRYVNNTSTQKTLFNDVLTCSDSSSTVNQLGFPVGRVITYDGATNEDVLGVLASSDFPIYMENVTRSQIRRVGLGGFNIATNTISFVVGEDLTAWADNDDIRLHTTRKAEITSAAGIAFDVSFAMPAGARFALIEGHTQDSGVPSSTGSPLVIFHSGINGVINRRVKHLVAAIDHYVQIIVEIDEADPTIYIDLDASGAGTLQGIFLIRGWFLQEKV